MCQVLGKSPNLKYQSDGGPGIQDIMNILLGSVNAIEDRRNFFKSQILFWLLAAPDGHAKNFSIHLLPNGRYRLTPLYDIISAYPLFSPFYPMPKLKMAMALRGKSNKYQWTQFLPRHFESTAKHAKFSEKEAKSLVLEMLKQVDQAIDVVIKELPQDFPAKISESIFEGMRSLAAKMKLETAEHPLNNP